MDLNWLETDTQQHCPSHKHDTLYLPLQQISGKQAAVQQAFPPGCQQGTSRNMKHTEPCADRAGRQRGAAADTQRTAAMHARRAPESTPTHTYEATTHQMCASSETAAAAAGDGAQAGGPHPNRPSTVRTRLRQGTGGGPEGLRPPANEGQLLNGLLQHRDAALGLHRVHGGGLIKRPGGSNTPCAE